MDLKIFQVSSMEFCSNREYIQQSFCPSTNLSSLSSVKDVPGVFLILGSVSAVYSHHVEWVETVSPVDDSSSGVCLAAFSLLRKHSEEVWDLPTK